MLAGGGGAEGGERGTYGGIDWHAFTFAAWTEVQSP